MCFLFVVLMAPKRKHRAPVEAQQEPQGRQRRFDLYDRLTAEADPDPVQPRGDLQSFFMRQFGELKSEIGSLRTEVRQQQHGSCREFRYAGLEALSELNRSTHGMDRDRGGLN